MNLAERCRPIRLLLSDVDGVMTDGGIYFNDQRIETKQFHIHDGLGIRLWMEAGHNFGIVTSRKSIAVSQRAKELKIDLVRQGVAEKLPVVQAITKECGLFAENVAYLGDDLPDLPVLRWVGLGIAVSNARQELLEYANHVPQSSGGSGAVREIVEEILKAQDRWEDMIRRFGV